MGTFDNATSKVTVPEHVMHRSVLEEAVMLNLETERYTGIDEVGRDMLDAIAQAANISEGIDALVEIYEVERSIIAADVDTFLAELVERGLVEISAAA